jgi:hypothetical protein
VLCHPWRFVVELFFLVFERHRIGSFCLVLFLSVSFVLTLVLITWLVIMVHCILNCLLPNVFVETGLSY